MANLVSPFTVSPLQSGSGFLSPGFTVDSSGNLQMSGNLSLTAGTIALGSNNTVLTATTLGSGIVNSSLTNLGTLTALNVSGPTSLTGSVSIAPSSAPGTINNVIIGNAIPTTATFTNLTATGNINLSPTGSNTYTIAPAATGSINNMNIGVTTPASGNFTTLGTTGVLTITNTTAATNAVTGALVVSGGVGIAGNVYIAGNLVVSGIVTDSGEVVTGNVSISGTQTIGGINIKSLAIAMSVALS
jgi:hypothetical protein